LDSVFHIIIFLSPEQEAKYLQSFEKARSLTQSECCFWIDLFLRMSGRGDEIIVGALKRGVGRVKNK
jgi:hypothetical protein